MKVICSYAGKQVAEDNVVIGSTYTVTDWSYGWECMNFSKPDDMFYQLAEMPEDRRYWSGLFSELIDQPQTEKFKNKEA